MEITSDSIGVIAILIAIFLAIGVYVWQASRSDARLDRLEGRLDRMESRLEGQIEGLRDEIRLASQRVSDSELEQARLNGVNSVLERHLHTHEAAAD